MDWDGDLYQRCVNVDLLAGIRQVRAFGSAEELRDQIRQDVESARRLCARHRARE